MQCMFSVFRNGTAELCIFDHGHTGDHARGKSKADADRKMNWLYDEERVKDEFIRHVAIQFDEWKKLWSLK